MSVTGGGDWKDALYAVQEGDMEKLRYHISEGVDLNYQHPEAFTTLLMEAVNVKKYEMMTELVDKGADPLQKEGFSAETAMDIASKAGDKKAIGILKKYIPKKKRFGLF